MPEIAEVARIVHFLRLHLVGKKIAKVSAPDDTIIFGKVGTSGPEIEAALKGRKVVSAGSQGKCFWITLDKAPHVVMHLGMTGWIHIKGEQTAYTNYYKKMNGDTEQWPPRFWKWHIVMDTKPALEVAFTDPRRLGRVRLVDCPGEDIRQHPPLSANGPDPVVDPDFFTMEYLQKKMKSRKVPIKALLLDQTVISGIGNWVADEVLYQSRTHPEQYCNDFANDHIQRLYDAIRMVCQTACDKLGNSDEFPENWLFKHRWGKGKKVGTLPNGEKLAFLTVGGRTSCYAPALQTKTGRVAKEAEVKEEELADADEEEKKPSAKKRKFADTFDGDSETEEAAPPTKSRSRARVIKSELSADEEEKKPSAKRRKVAGTFDGDSETWKAAPRTKSRSRARVKMPELAADALLPKKKAATTNQAPVRQATTNIARVKPEANEGRRRSTRKG